MQKQSQFWSSSIMSCHVMSCLTGPGLDGTSSCSTSNTSHGQMGTLVPISDLRHLAGDSEIVLAKFLENRLKIDREIGEKHALQVNVTCQIQDGGCLYLHLRCNRS